VSSTTKNRSIAGEEGDDDEEELLRGNI